MSYPARDPRSGIDGQANASATETNVSEPCVLINEVGA